MLHIASESDWDRAQESGVYALPAGVIHGCSSSQLRLVVEARFPSQDGFVLLSIDESKASGEIRSVTFREGGRSETFPHLHGSFPITAVLSVCPLAEALSDIG